MGFLELDNKEIAKRGWEGVNIPGVLKVVESVIFARLLQIIITKSSALC